MNSVGDWIKDRVWATATGAAGVPQPIPERAFPGEVDAGSVAAVLSTVAAAEGAEEERGKAVDQKLLAILQFAAIAVSVSLGVATFLAVAPRPGLAKGPFTVIVCVAAYVSIQCFRAALAAVDGLGRRGFARPTLIEMAWREDSNMISYQHRIAYQRLCCLAQNGEVINQKVSCMAVAHASVKNALAVLVLTSAGLALVAVVRNWVPHWLPC